MLIQILKRVAVVIDKDLKWLDTGSEVDLCDDDAQALIRGGDAKEVKKVEEIKEAEEVEKDEKAIFEAPGNKSFFGSSKNK